MTHDFKLFPELTNSQMAIYYMDSPHRQILENIRAKVVKVTDGDTIRVKWEERDFDFPVRFARVAAPELDEEGGIAAQKFLSERILGEDVDIILTRQRVEKWGRLLADIVHLGVNENQALIEAGYAVPWEARPREWF